jgi:hypothetical protein
MTVEQQMKKIKQEQGLLENTVKAIKEAQKLHALVIAYLTIDTLQTPENAAHLREALVVGSVSLDMVEKLFDELNVQLTVNL